MNWITKLKTFCELGRLIFRPLQCEMHGTGLYNCQQIVACSSSKCLCWFQLIYQNLSWLQYCVLLPCVWLRNILRKWFVTTVLTLPTHVLQPQNFVWIFCNDSEAILRVFQLFSQEVKYFYQKNTWKNSRILFILWKWLWNYFGKEFASERVEAAYIARTIFIFYSYFKSCVYL